MSGGAARIKYVAVGDDLESGIVFRGGGSERRLRQQNKSNENQSVACEVAKPLERAVFPRFRLRMSYPHPKRGNTAHSKRFARLGRGLGVGLHLRAGARLHTVAILPTAFTRSAGFQPAVSP